MKASSGGGRSMTFSATAHRSPSPTPRTCIERSYFLAPQEPAPHAPSLPFFLPGAAAAPGFAGAAPGFAAAAGAAAGAAGVAGAAGAAAAGDDIVGGFAAGAAGVSGAAGVAGVEVSAAGVIGVAAAGGGGAVGVAGSGADPPQAATPSAAAANPKILSRSVISIAIPPVDFDNAARP